MKRLVLLLALSATALADTTYTTARTNWILYDGTAKVKDVLPQATEESCLTSARALVETAKVSKKYKCRADTTFTIAYVAPLPARPTCTAPKPANESRAMACQNSDTQFWQQDREYASAAYPACWTPGEWKPTAPTDTECLPPPVPPTPPTDAIYVGPGESISAAVARLKPGGEVIVRPGTYAPFSLKACGPDAWCTVRAEIDGTVIATGLSIGKGAWYTSIEGMKFTGSNSKTVTGSYVKLKRCAFTGGPLSGNTSLLQIGTNDYTATDHVLIEDSWVYGAGGRYKILVYNASDIVLRRVVTRWDAGWKNVDGAPEADIAVYDSARVEVQNAIALDGQGSGAYVAVFYNPVNGGTSTPNTTRAWRGCIAINVPMGYYMGTEGQSSMTGLVVEHGAGFALKYGVSQLKGTGNVYRNLTLVNLRGDGFGIFGGSASISTSIVAVQTGKAFNGASCTTCLTTAAGATLITGVSGRGATITKRIGHDGTLYGEDGFNTTTDEDLWPWPNEARIKADFDSVRPAFAGKSLTEYVKTAIP